MEKTKTTESQDRSITIYRSRDGQEIKLSFDVVRRYLVSGHPEWVTEGEFLMYMGMCKSRGLNPFKRDIYLIKMSKEDPAAMVVSIDYFRSRARAQKDCVGWHEGIVVKVKGDNIEYRVGSIVWPGEELVGGWFRAKPSGWTDEYTWTVPLDRYIKKTREGKLTRFWDKPMQPEMICKVAASQGLRRCWPDEFQGLYIKEEIVREVDPEPAPEPTAIETTSTPSEEQPKNVDEFQAYLTKIETATRDELSVLITNQGADAKRLELAQEQTQKAIVAMNNRRTALKEEGH